MLCLKLAFWIFSPGTFQQITTYWPDPLKVGYIKTSPNRAGVAEPRLKIWDKNLGQNLGQKFGTDRRTNRRTDRQDQT